MSAKDTFLAELERKEEKEVKIKEILDSDFLDGFTRMDHTISSAFVFLSEVQKKRKRIVKRSFSIAPSTCMKRMKNEDTYR